MTVATLMKVRATKIDAPHCRLLGNSSSLKADC